MTKVALCQYHPEVASADNLRLSAALIERAALNGADLVVFSDSFLGFDAPPVPEAPAEIAAAAAANRVEVLTGRVAGADGQWAQAALIGADGQVKDMVRADQLKLISTCLGETLILTESQAYSPETDRRAAELRPKVMVMQANAISLLELEAIKELAIDRSFNQAHLVISISVVGSCRDELCLGASLAVLQGEILVEAGTAAGEIADFSVDPAAFLDYDILRDRVRIPELLRRKYGPPITHGGE